MESTMHAKVRELLTRWKRDAGSFAAAAQVPTLMVYAAGTSFAVEGGEVDCGALVWRDGAIDIDAIDVVHIHPEWSAGQ